MGKSQVSFDRWTPQAQLAQELNISEHTIERLVAHGHIRASDRGVLGRWSMVVLHPDDCTKMRGLLLSQPRWAEKTTPKRKKTPVLRPVPRNRDSNTSLSVFLLSSNPALITG